MNEELKKRIADVRKYLDEQFKDKPGKWWQCKVNEIIPTRDMGGGEKYYPHNPEETVVKYDVKGALISSALFFVISLIFFVTGNYEMDPAYFVQISIFMVVILIALLRDAVKDKNFIMIFNRHGFRIGAMPEPVPWKHLVASYIRENNSGEDSTYYLLMYYYDEVKDEFEKIEKKINGLDVNKEDIALQIEYWKMISRTGATLV